VDVDFYWPCISIGNTLDAIRFAATNKTCLLLNSFPDVNSFDISGSLAGPEEEWASSVYDLYNQALMPIPGAVDSIRVTDDVMVVVTSNGGRYKIAFDKAYLFATNNVLGLEGCLEKTFLHNKVVDWFDAIRGGDNHYHLGPIPDETITQAGFYPSNRIDGRVYYDLFSVSRLSEEQLISHEHSDTAVRFKIQKMAEQLGKNLILKFWKRDIFKVYNVMCTAGMPSKISWMGGSIESHDD
tara:strand:+ start:501 stop:1220 length:720 start_codon:yes stop_codon:yes gene_type:complete